MGTFKFVLADIGDLVTQIDKGNVVEIVGRGALGALNDIRVAGEFAFTRGGLAGVLKKLLSDAGVQSGECDLPTGDGDIWFHNVPLMDLMRHLAMAAGSYLRWDRSNVFSIMSVERVRQIDADSPVHELHDDDIISMRFEKR